LVILVVVLVESWLRDFVTAHALIPLFSLPWSLLQMELAQFQIAFRFRCDYLASAAAFVSHSAFVLLMVKYRLGRESSEQLFHAPWPPLRPRPRPHPGGLFPLLWRRDSVLLGQVKRLPLAIVPAMQRRLG